MGVCQRPVRNLHHHIIDVVAAAVRRCFEIRGCDKDKRPGCRIDTEQGCIDTADNGIGQDCPAVGIACGHIRDGAEILSDSDRSCRPTEIGGDDRCLVDILDRHQDRLHVDAAKTIRDLNRHAIDIVRRAHILGHLEIG